MKQNQTYRTEKQAKSLHRNPDIRLIPRRDAQPGRLNAINKPRCVIPHILIFHPRYCVETHSNASSKHPMRRIAMRLYG